MNTQYIEYLKSIKHLFPEDAEYVAINKQRKLSWYYDEPLNGNIDYGYWHNNKEYIPDTIDIHWNNSVVKISDLNEDKMTQKICNTIGEAVDALLNGYIIEINSWKYKYCNELYKLVNSNWEVCCGIHVYDIIFGYCKNYLPITAYKENWYDNIPKEGIKCYVGPEWYTDDVIKEEGVITTIYEYLPINHSKFKGKKMFWAKAIPVDD